ncbi:cupin domain-containing protein [Rhodoligotrophos defluvii]|uniref:cupin domain-containing protein n=1 Tax=Rhodoligotrophos defluvii TaxID=2561934 RepID=UPI0014855CCF|nr:cupin domain-containing protein [Rhodoligotrophos defluvii]
MSRRKALRWRDLPTKEVLDGMMHRAAYRSDEALLTFNWIEPGMPRWMPHSHPFDQIVITVRGTQILEIENEILRCPAGSIARVPANAKHTGWPEGDEQVLNIDVFAPPRPDYLHFAAHQSEYPQPEPGYPVYHQNPRAAPPGGKWMEDTTGLLYRWEDLPKTSIEGGKMERAAFRGDHTLLSFNWVPPHTERMTPHKHPFDQLVLVMSGSLALEIEGEVTECPPESIIRIPAGATHTGWANGDEPVLNLDVFAPAREDYLPLTKYQKDYA